jgi:hypothetical protein
MRFKRSSLKTFTLKDWLHKVSRVDCEKSSKEASADNYTAILMMNLNFDTNGNFVEST